MENVFVIRKVALGALALSGLLFIAMAVAGHDAFRWFALTAHASLAIFVATESFGPVAQKRSGFGRCLARFFLGIYVLMGISALTLFVAGHFR